MNPNQPASPPAGVPQPPSGGPPQGFIPQPPHSNYRQQQQAQAAVPAPPSPNGPAGFPGQPAEALAQAGQPQLPPAPGYPAAPLQQPGTAAPRISNPNSTQNTLQISEIRDGIVIMNDGSFRSVVIVKSINFDLMSPDEREAVEYAYQGFLNSLYFPVQIFIRSQKVDLRPYIERLDKIRQEQDNMLLGLLMDDYLAFIAELATQTNIMDKRFYIVIPYFPIVDVQKAITQSRNFFSGLAGLFNTKEQHVVINETDLNKAKDELRNRVQAVLAGLQQCGIPGLPLDTQEMIELFYDSYNPDTATRQQLKNFNDLTVPVVTKGEGAAPQPHLDKEIQG